MSVGSTISYFYIFNDYMSIFFSRKDDLIVGAPYYYETSDKLTFGGAIYVYLGDSNNVVSILVILALLLLLLLLRFFCNASDYLMWLLWVYVGVSI